MPGPGHTGQAEALLPLWTACGGSPELWQWSVVVPRSVRWNSGANPGKSRGAEDDTGLSRALSPLPSIPGGIVGHLALDPASR